MARASTSLLVTSVVLLGAYSAFAQESRPERPYRGLFGGGTDDSAHVVSVNGSAGSGYDTSANLAATEAGVVGISNPTGSQGSLYNQFSGGLTYSGRLERFSAGASLSSSARQYPQLDISTTTSHAASTRLGVNLGQNTTLNGGAAATYQSTRAFTPFAPLGDPLLDLVTAPNQDYGTSSGNYYTYTTSAGLTQQLSRRTSLIATYDRLTTKAERRAEDLLRQTGSFRVTRTLTRYLGLRLGYGYTEARYGISNRQFENHNLDTGLDYSRDLSLTRRTKLAFTSGATALRQEGAIRYDVTGSARLSREIARTWNADISYQRNVGFIESVLEPMFYDAINAGFGGLINRRVSFRSGAGATRGSIGLTSRPANGFGAWTGSAGVNSAMTRNLSLGVNYTFYRYSFEEGAASVTGLPSNTNRHSVNMTLSAWAPLLQRGKRSNATR